MNKKQIRLTESNLRNIVKESVKRMLRETVNPSSNIEYMDKDSFYNTVVETLNEHVDGWNSDYDKYKDYIKDDIVPDYAWQFVEESISSMKKYIESGNYSMKGNFADIKLNYEHDHKEGPRFDEVVSMIQQGENNQYTEEFKEWTISWFWYAFGTFGLTYNFDNACDAYIDDELNENKKNMKLTESKLRKIIKESVKKTLTKMNEGSAFRHSNNEWDNDYFVNAKMLAKGIYDILEAMEDDGNSNDIHSTEYLYHELEKKVIELNQTYKLIKNYIKHPHPQAQP